MADAEGFEPPRRYRVLSVFKTDPFSRLGKHPHGDAIEARTRIFALKGRCPNRLDYSAKRKTPSL